MRHNNWFNNRLGLVLLSLCFAVISEAKIVLPNLISDGMVLQRGTPVKIWGKADSGEKIQLTFLKKKYQAVADSLGNWQIDLPALKPGGPFSMSINDTTLQNILIGDVFLCSGQSNMELMVSRVMDKYADEVNLYENPSIRYLKVPYAYDFNTPLSDIKSMAWKPLTKDNVMGYSALCYFFAKLLYEKTGVPVGIVNSSWGGTPVEAWISEEGLKDYPIYLNQKSLYSSEELMNEIQRTGARHGRQWQAVLHASDKGLHDTTLWYDENLDDSAWDSVDMFSSQWGSNGWRPINGSHWFRQSVEVPASWKGKDAVLRLGCIVDADSVYVNGHFVGSVSYQYPPRIYKVPASVLKPGKNQITVRLISNGGYPHFVKEKPYKLVCGSEEVNLSTTWKHRVGTVMPSMPGGSVAFQNMPLGLYNGMIAPLLNYQFKGVVWYQGESNVGKWKEYSSLLVSLMNDWRSKFGNAQLPFYIIELASFMSPDNPGKFAWGKLQEQQADAVSKVSNATLIKNSDTGEWNDIHPLDKKTAAGRLVEAVLAQ
ncbi:sialate O-acetylesterase [uncultured Bacteroides sp.]|jgi:sialate O-acetylesterase|uniref:sialate O-acetylesterase n=1 Tax=uncultured Bacteroides sp. TaxID=162156 RepID=UPI00280AAD65|nr:sialate O-acetylesterase [uncultured Bacteroides sp.]